MFVKKAVRESDGAATAPYQRCFDGGVHSLGDEDIGNSLRASRRVVGFQVLCETARVCQIQPTV